MRFCSSERVLTCIVHIHTLTVVFFFFFFNNISTKKQQQNKKQHIQTLYSFNNFFCTYNSKDFTFDYLSVRNYFQSLHFWWLKRDNTKFISTQTIWNQCNFHQNEKNTNAECAVDVLLWFTLNHNGFREKRKKMFRFFQHESPKCLCSQCKALSTNKKFIKYDNFLCVGKISMLNIALSSVQLKQHTEKWIVLINFQENCKIVYVQLSVHLCSNNWTSIIFLVFSIKNENFAKSTPWQATEKN